MTDTRTILLHSRNGTVRALKGTIERLRPASERHLAFIHIGKCGGETVNTVLKESRVVAERFNRVSRTHVARPVYKPANRYLFVVRNPISRAISAFNWRYRLVITSRTSDRRFPGEREVLARYQTLDALALALYDGDRLRADVARDVRKIHHLREDIAFYLGHAFDVITSEQIFAVLCQEFLDADIKTYLGISGVERVHDNRSATSKPHTELTDRARANLARFLARDYACLEQLLSLFPIAAERRETLLRK